MLVTMNHHKIDEYLCTRIYIGVYNYIKYTVYYILIHCIQYEIHNFINISLQQQIIHKYIYIQINSKI